jgi:hypothetical protein
VDHLRVALTVGAVLPPGATPSSVKLNGKPVEFEVVETTRGNEVRVASKKSSGTLTIHLK